MLPTTYCYTVIRPSVIGDPAMDDIRNISNSTQSIGVVMTCEGSFNKTSEEPVNRQLYLGKTQMYHSS